MTQKTKVGDLECVVVNPRSTENPQAVVILCHGFGAPSTDLVSLVQELTRTCRNQDVVYVFPGAPIEMDPLFDARAWWMIDIEKIQQLMVNGETREMRSTSPELLPERRQSINTVINHFRFEYSLPATQIIVGGFSQGAMLTTDVALHYPDPLGGLIIWSGALINEPTWTEKAQTSQSLDIVQSHGRIDPILPMSGAEDLRTMLTQAGHQVEFCEFPGQHSIPAQAIELAGQLIDRVAV